MLKYFVFALAVVMVSSASAGDFILRATSDCCDGDSLFHEGSEAIVFQGNSVRGTSKLASDSYFEFDDIDSGKYDLAIAAAGYYPEKFLGLEIGKDSVFDFEFVVPLQPVARSAILEGHVIVRFKRTLSNDEITQRLDSWGLDPLQRSSSTEETQQPEHRITRSQDFAEVRAIYDRSKDLAELIWTALKDPTVKECSPVYFSKRR